MKKNKLAGNSLVKTLWQNKVAQTNISVAGIATNRSSHQRCSMKKCVLKNFVKFTGKHLCQRLFFNKVEPATLLKKRLDRFFSCEFYKIFKNTFFTELLWMNFSELSSFWCVQLWWKVVIINQYHLLLTIEQK